MPDDVARLIGYEAGPIRLLNGVEGRHGGFGMCHIVSHEGRIKQLEGLGFRDVVTYAYFIASGYQLIVEGEEGRLIFQRERESVIHQLVCQWDVDIPAWSITTAIPKRAVRNQKVIWRKAV